MIEKAEKAIQMGQMILPRIQKGFRYLSVLRRGVFLVKSKLVNRDKQFIKRQFKQYKKAKKRVLRQKQRQALLWGFHKNMQIIKIGRWMQKRYF